MKTNPNDPAFPHLKSSAMDLGLTKRELFAAVLHAGILAGEIGRNVANRANLATTEADALIAALNKDTP